ncbi:unnamed protein product [Brassica oleracea]
MKPNMAWSVQPSLGRMMAFSAPTTMLRSVAVTRFISKSVHLATPCLSSHTVIWWVLPTQRKKPRQWLLRSRLLMDQMMKIREGLHYNPYLPVEKSLCQRCSTMKLLNMEMELLQRKLRWVKMLYHSCPGQLNQKWK